MAVHNETADISIRPVTEADDASLWRLLCHATLMPGGDTPENVAEAQNSAILSHYVTDWGRTGDVGVIAQTVFYKDIHGSGNQYWFSSWYYIRAALNFYYIIYTIILAEGYL